MLSNAARWPGPKAGWCVRMRAEAFLGLDFFGTFCIKAKSTERKFCEHRCVMLSASGANEKQCVSFKPHENEFE